MEQKVQNSIEYVPSSQIRGGDVKTNRESMAGPNKTQIIISGAAMQQKYQLEKE